MHTYVNRKSAYICEYKITHIDDLIQYSREEKKKKKKSCDKSINFFAWACSCSDSNGDSCKEEPLEV